MLPVLRDPGSDLRDPGIRCAGSEQGHVSHTCVCSVRARVRCEGWEGHLAGVADGEGGGQGRRGGDGAVERGAVERGAGARGAVERGAVERGAGEHDADEVGGGDEPRRRRTSAPAEQGA